MELLTLKMDISKIHSCWFGIDCSWTHYGVNSTFQSSPFGIEGSRVLYSYLTHGLRIGQGLSLCRWFTTGTSKGHIMLILVHIWIGFQFAVRFPYLHVSCNNCNRYGMLKTPKGIG
jgi:hypothetical protein